MEFVKGLVVRSAAGRDKGGLFTVVEVDGDYAMICDGRHRRLEHPKRKKWKHLVPSTTILAPASLTTNREIRRALAYASGEGCAPLEESI